MRSGDFAPFLIEPAPVRLTELFNLAYSKLGYLKIVTPKFAGDDARGSGGRFVVVNGAVVDGAAEVQSRATHK